MNNKTKSILLLLLTATITIAPMSLIESIYKSDAEREKILKKILSGRAEPTIKPKIRENSPPKPILKTKSERTKKTKPRNKITFDLPQQRTETTNLQLLQKIVRKIKK